MAHADPLVALPDTDRQYHIDLAPGEVADYILLPGDPDRTDRIAGLLDSVEVARRHREFDSVTGWHRGLRISVVATGIGTDNVEIVMAEVLALTRRPTFVRIGSCGVLRDDIALGDLVITTGAVRLEATTRVLRGRRVPGGGRLRGGRRARRGRRPARTPAHLGITATAPGFYGAQGRPIPQLPLRYPDLAERLRGARRPQLRDGGLGAARAGALAGCRAGVVCTAYAQRVRGDFVMGARRDAAEAGLVETGLEALRVLAEMDSQREQAREMHWRPSLWASTMAT